MIADRKAIPKTKSQKVDYLISNTWYLHQNILSKNILSNKDLVAKNAINISKTGFLVF